MGINVFIGNDLKSEWGNCLRTTVGQSGRSWSKRAKQPGFLNVHIDPLPSSLTPYRQFDPRRSNLSSDRPFWPQPFIFPLWPSTVQFDSWSSTLTPVHSLWTWSNSRFASNHKKVWKIFGWDIFDIIEYLTDLNEKWILLTLIIFSDLGLSVCIITLCECLMCLIYMTNPAVRQKFFDQCSCLPGSGQTRS